MRGSVQRLLGDLNAHLFGQCSGKKAGVGHVCHCNSILHWFGQENSVFLLSDAVFVLISEIITISCHVL